MVGVSHFDLVLERVWSESTFKLRPQCVPSGNNYLQKEPNHKTLVEMSLTSFVSSFSLKKSYGYNLMSLY